MPDLDIYSGPAWMQIPKTGTQGQPMSLAEAFQLKQQQKQQDALLPLKQQEMQAQIANMALDHQIKQEAVDDMLQSKGATAAYLQARSAITDWTDPKQTGALDAILAKNPTVPQWLVQDTRMRESAAKVYDARLATAETRAQNAELYTSTKLEISKAQLDAQKLRLEEAISSKEKIAGDNRRARADLEVLKQNFRLNDKGKMVTWPEFLNRHLEGYVRNSGATPADAATALRKLYDDHVAPQSVPGSTPSAVDPKDPLGVFKKKQMPQ